MQPLFILIGTFILVLVVSRIIKKNWRPYFAGKLAMSVMLVFTASGHFLFPDGMALMLPESIPFRKEIIYATGVIELAAAVGILIPRFQRLTGWLLIIFFISILPANIYAAMHRVNLQTASYDGKGLEYLWFRIPLQILYIEWVYYFVIGKKK
jgi:uncharacterized membrane protein